MLSTTHDISVRGRTKQVPAWHLNGSIIVATGTVLQIAEVFDEHWLENDELPDPLDVIQQLKSVDCKPDLFTFAQPVPDTHPRFTFHTEWDNMAVVPVSSYDRWFTGQISPASRRNIRATEKKGVVVKVAEFDEKFVRGIVSVYNDSPIRHGRKFWHHGKAIETVRAENGTYLDRSTFLGAYLGPELIGFAKVVHTNSSASIMQIVSKLSHFDKRPNNALLSGLIRLCAERSISYLVYCNFVYGKNTNSSLTRFKRENGFVGMDLPRYYVPITRRGDLFVRLGLHRGLKARLPQWLISRLLSVRAKWYEVVGG